MFLKLVSQYIGGILCMYVENLLKFREGRKQKSLEGGEHGHGQLVGVVHYC